MAGNFQLPFQCIQYLERQCAEPQKLLIASSGGKIYSYTAETGQRLSSWPQDVNASNANNCKPTETETGSEDQAPPEKKRKVSQSEDGPAETSKSPVKTPAWSSIPILVAHSSGDYVVALTAEDKCIRVLRLKYDGTFEQLSERCMPKRPCSIVLTDDGNTILCGDKFGDVYSLPLLPSNEPYVAPKLPNRPKVPAATPLTVHSKRNLESLEQQLRYGQKNPTEEKTSLNFQHQLLLGHVSLLTGVAFATVPQDDNSGQKRSYILTGDRDEHIRVSRYPQAHIIEGYCLGHTAFITKLCIPKSAPEYLISGGGDDFLLVWKWAEGVTVRGIWATSIGGSNIVLVALDGSSQLQCFVLESNGTLKTQDPIEMSGNVLDIAIMEKESTIVVSVDSIREKGSTHEWRASPTGSLNLIESFRVKLGAENLEWEPVTESLVTNINLGGSSDIPADADTKQRKELNELFYSLSNLRKTHGED
ncbi:tRNA (guanine-N(7)-)-methyltransferase subunit TRM82 [Aspergillus nomiae NRRL 13137]|uniref:tRNA (Guanine-N(7)-)-methyltransferase subunit TRM82 n=1 Tax=Aspergillus nomiae NRRL (strain ATCC 15546 / NRRL 13137 / CBS 260.88 / M93) TaxID=1509407 RepID=A0A0L1IWU5_ASPN3|nr:tRNA (guanine-N(7)-)-methyltransferase subunit TRM82 [Aspergillus nomiae NRRL 13137]KNG83952.1 tRNA (guanine-N(7)-)-methyltransferase subunit TRM82 [Aspergillus nomiae NRRL 13137]